MVNTRRTQPYDDGFGHWFAGFFDGEGCFGVYKANYKGRHAKFGWRCQAQISLRADDRPILEEIAARTGVGRVHMQGKGLAAVDRNPCAAWFVRTREGCAVIVDIFERYPLRAKKAADFAIWAEAVREWHTSAPARPRPQG
jgi:hypothetical protein